MCHPKPGTFSTTRTILKKPTTNRMGPARPGSRFHTVTGVFIESDLQLRDSDSNGSEGGSFWTMAYPADSEVERRAGSFASHASTSEARYRTSRPIRINGTPPPLSRSFCRLERERRVTRDSSRSDRRFSTMEASCALWKVVAACSAKRGTRKRCPKYAHNYYFGLGLFRSR